MKINLSHDNIIPLNSSKATGVNLLSSFLPSDPKEEICPLRSLWRAVIMQALSDAGSNSNKMEMKKEKARAISWLEGESDDFATVCELADYNPDEIKQKAKEAIKRGCKWRKNKNPFLKR